MRERSILRIKRCVKILTLGQTKVSGADYIYFNCMQLSYVIDRIPPISKEEEECFSYLTISSVH